MKRKVINRIIIQIIVILGAIVFIFPFLWLVSTSLKPDEQIFALPPKLIPNPVQWENYTRMFKYFPFSRFFGNSVYITFMTLVGVLFSCPLVAFSFAKLRWPGRDLLFLVLLSTMMLPPQVTMVPVYLLFRELGWIDTFRPLWVPAWFGSAFYIFLLRQFFLTIPRELEEAARIDGCSFPRMYAQIMLPLIKPALATTAIFTFMGAWNDFMGPLIYINSTEKFPLSLGLRLFQTQFGGEWAMMMAASVIMVLPLIIMFIAFQRYFIQGIVLTGLKM